MTRRRNSPAAHRPNWGISISVSQLPGFSAESVPRCISVEDVGQHVGQVVHLGQHAVLRRLRAAGHRHQARGRARRALRAEARQEERASAHRHHIRVLRVPGCDHALALLRVLLGTQGRAICATQGGTHCREANQHNTNAHMLYALHR